jgi:hypothetical protein
VPGFKHQIVSGEDYFAFFLSHGWQAKAVRYIMDVAQKLGRPAPTWVRVMFALRGLFLSSEERDQRKNSMAYVLFEPCLKRQPWTIDAGDMSGTSA